MQAGPIRSTIQGPLKNAGFVLEDVTVTAAGRRSVVRVAVDRDLSDIDADDHASVIPPLSLDDVADATRVVDAAIEADAGTGDAPYVLEVSSPGVDRPLTLPRHLRRNVGRLVVLALGDGSSVAGRITAVGPDSLELDTDQGGRSIDLAAVRQGRVQIEFGRVDEPGQEQD